MKEFKLGYWYNITTPTLDINQIKLVPSQRILESQNSKETFYDVLLKHSDNKITIGLNGTLSECHKFIFNNFQINLDLIEDHYLQNLIEELQQDREFLKRGSHKRDWEISLHIGDSIDYLNHLLNKRTFSEKDLEK